MSKPAKDKAELLERLAKEVLCDGIIICHHQKSCVGCFAKADAALAAIRAAGWTVVPVEPTEKMLDAAERAFPVESFDFYSMCRVEWAAMLAAAPGVEP